MSNQKKLNHLGTSSSLEALVQEHFKSLISNLFIIKNLVFKTSYLKTNSYEI